MKYNFNLSYSAYSTWKSSPLQFYFQYIKKAKPIDKVYQCYGDAGTVVHSMIQSFIENSNKDFDTVWQLYKLTEQLDMKGYPLLKDSYKKMYDNGIIFFTKEYFNKSNKFSCEYKLEKEIYDISCKGFVDVVVNDGENITFLDWKTNSKNSYEMHKDQRLFYSWLLWKISNIIPKCRWIYLRNNNVHEDMFSLKEIMKFDFEIQNFLRFIDDADDDINKYVAGNWKNPFNSYYALCAEEVNRRENMQNKIITLNIKGNFVFFEGDVDDKFLLGVDFATKFDLPDKYFMQEAVKKRGGLIDLSDVGTVHLLNTKFKCFPVGLLKKVKQLVKEFNEYYDTKIVLKIVDSRDKNIMNQKFGLMPYKLQTNKVLRPYQKEAVDIFMKEKTGIINVPTGGGKTLIAAEILRQVDGKVLWIIDRNELLKQTKEELESLIDIKCGIIAGGIVEFQNVTLATVQSLNSKLDKLKSYFYTVNFVVVDEYHKSAAATYQKVFAKLPNNMYRLGLTATVGRDDGKEPILYSILGDVIYKISTQELIGLDHLTRPIIYFIKMPEEIIKQEYVDDYHCNIVENDERNQRIVDCCKDKNKILILTKIVDHGKKLKSMIPSSRFIHGSLDKITRENDMDWFRKTKSGVLIMTLSIGAEGLDIPDLDIIINAAANRGDVKSVQVLGRVLRTFEGKKDALYIDFVDGGFHTYKHSLKRMQIFKNKSHDVEVIE